jgi:hypothetical protein
MNIAGATAANYSFTNAQCSDAGIYDVMVTNVAGGIISSGAVLTVVAAPIIAAQPQSLTVRQGQNATFMVTATSTCGTNGLSYQWRLNGTDIGGETASTFTRINAQFSDAGNYSVVVSNLLGAVTSSNATLVVLPGEIYFEASFEAGLDACVISNTYSSGNGLWHRSIGRGLQSGHSASNSLYYGTNEVLTGGGNFDTGSNANSGAVISPAINLSGLGPPINLTFNYLLATENFQNYDEARVEVSTNGSPFFVVAGNKAGNTRLFDSRTASAWTNAIVDLSSFAGQQLLLRFTFNTKDALTNQFEGWYVDDIRVAGPVSSANDQFANRITLSGRTTATLGSNVGASKEAGEPNHVGNVGGKSVWWTWIAPANGPVTISTCGSDFDTLLAVYTGSAVNALTPVPGAANDDFCGVQSQVGFTAVAGTAYQIAVDGYNASTGFGAHSGNITLAIQQ